jgi:hypothetical protein
MAAFESWRSYWNFERAIRRRTRYVHDGEVGVFLGTVLETGQKRVETIPREKFFWRAQLGYAWRPIYEGNEYVTDAPHPYPPERMKPLNDRAIEGRANSKGIPYLYFATNRETALAEVRPWIGSLISVGQFKTLRDLRVVNCTTDRKGSHVYIDREPSPEEREESVWGDIDKAFARPVTPSDDVADYVPTQIIAELFKMHGFDGVAYRSSLGPGHNLALFDLDTAELINCHLFEVKAINFEFRETTNPYFMKKHYDTKEAGHERA